MEGEYGGLFTQNRGNDLKLALYRGSDPDIISLGFVSDEMKFAVMASARAQALFSQFESLSMIVLESMIMGRPVLVNGKCEVLKGHCVRSNAGLYFTSYTEFVGTLNYLLTHPTQYEVMSENAVKYGVIAPEWLYRSLAANVIMCGEHRL